MTNCVVGQPVPATVVTLIVMKRIALLLIVCSACKTTDSAPKQDPTPTPVEHSAPAAPPALPSDPSANSAMGSGDRPSLPPGHHRGDRFAKMDKDGDGVISDEERAAAMKERAAQMRAKLDTNGDGKLTPDELAGAKGRMHFDDPAALDTNKDGDISVDELAAGMQARRDARRAAGGSATEQ
jgi:hypothetical protein